MCGSSQFGSGLSGGGGRPLLPVFMLGFLSDYCKRFHLSVAYVFMDIVTAFAVLLKRIMFDEIDQMRHGSINYLSMVLMIMI